MLWARSADRARAFHVDGFDIELVPTVAALAAEAQLIVTTTSSHRWLLGAADIWPGTHITAVGAAGGGKQELEPQLFAAAGICVVDSRSQCSQYGDSSFALKEHFINPKDLVEIGEIVENAALGRQAGSEITIADLTGVAVQDIAIAELVGRALEYLK